MVVVVVVENETLRVVDIVAAAFAAAVAHPLNFQQNVLNFPKTMINKTGNKKSWKTDVRWKKNHNNSKPKQFRLRYLYIDTWF